MMMNHKLLKPVTCIAALTSLNGCVSPRWPSSSCKAAPSRAIWTATVMEGRVEGQVRDLKEDLPIGNMELVLDGGETRQRTDAEGNFAFDRVHEGRHLVTTNGTVYLSRIDTLVLLPHEGLKGTVYLALPKDVLKHCELYHP
jgi:hypothetical protein